ncbi:hypothetical protein C4E24_07450 [ANME-1 cluster archaeon AG-394-G21]|nr:hypothetical protein [ANME-1 cluster archaeon AG-394-G21]
MSININIKLLVVLVIIALAIFSVVYYTSHREITDAHVLSLRAVDALKDTASYCFTISTNLSMPQIQEGDVEMTSGEGCVDYRNNKLCTTMTMMNHSIEMIVIGDMAYIRESNGSWQTQELSERSIWESSYDQLAQQRSILLNATNVTMHKEDNGWVLDIIPDKEEVVEQLGKTGTGLETIKEEELKDFTIRYWIEKDNYHITRIENKVELEMNIQGLVTPMELNSAIYLYDYNEKMVIEAPI